MSFKFSSPAKIILFGEHAVVYGHPAIAVPVSSLRVHAHARLTDEGRLRIHARDLGQEIVVGGADGVTEQSPLAWIVSRTLREINRPTLSAEIDVESDIPLASGLGSGAAISAALVRSVAALGDVFLSDSVVNDLVYQSEKIYHGNPSGVDNTVIVFEVGVYFKRNHRVSFLTMRNNYHFVIADTGIRASTKVAVDRVRELFEQDPAQIAPLLQDIGGIVNQARAALESEQRNESLIGILMTRNHKLLQTLQVSSSKLDQLVEAAEGAGAFGAKLSGGGMGGNMIALVDESTLEPVSNALKKAGAVRVIHTAVGGTA